MHLFVHHRFLAAVEHEVVGHGHTRLGWGRAGVDAGVGEGVEEGVEGVGDGVNEGVGEGEGVVDGQNVVIEAALVIH